MTQVPNSDGQLKIMAGIGFVCLQWSLLEHMLLGLIATIEGMPLEKVYRIFSGLDMIPRCGMAADLARDMGAPGALVSRIRAIRTALRDEKLDELRNAVVHGVHAYPDKSDSVTLTLPRANKNNRTKVVSALDLYELGKRLHFLTEETEGAGAEFFEWKMRVQQNRLKDAERQLREANTPAFLKLAKNFYARIQRIARDFKR